MALLTALEQQEPEQQQARLASRRRLEVQMLEQALRVWPQAQPGPERQQARRVVQASEPLAARVLAQPLGHGPRGLEPPVREPGRELERSVQPAWRWQARAQSRRAQPAVSPLPSRLLLQPLHRQRRVWSGEPSRLHQPGWSWNASSSR